MSVPRRNPLSRLWNAWWYGPISPLPLGLFRILFGLLVLAYGLLLFPDRVLWFSERGMLTTAQSDAYNAAFSPLPMLDVLHGLTDDRWLTVFFIVFLVAAVGLTIGWWTRLSSFLVFLGLASLHNRNAVIHNGGDTVMMVMAIYLLLSPAGAALSLDRLRRLRLGREGLEPPAIIPWAQRLMQLQVATVYCATSLSKLLGSHWRDGTAVYYPLHLPDSARFPVPWVDAQHLWFIHLLTWGAIAVELSLWTLLWVPRLRLWVLGAGVLLHLGIEYSLNIPLFSFTMIACYTVFLTGDEVRSVLRWIGRRGVVRPAFLPRGSQ